MHAFISELKLITAYPHTYFRRINYIEHSSRCQRVIFLFVCCKRDNDFIICKFLQKWVSIHTDSAWSFIYELKKEDVSLKRINISRVLVQNTMFTLMKSFVLPFLLTVSFMRCGSRNFPRNIVQRSIQLQVQLICLRKTKWGLFLSEDVLVLVSCDELLHESIHTWE